jgi:hypothetical protein
MKKMRKISKKIKMKSEMVTTRTEPDFNTAFIPMNRIEVAINQPFIVVIIHLP